MPGGRPRSPLHFLTSGAAQRGHPPLPGYSPAAPPAPLSVQRPTAFFEDEWRCPVRVRDIIRVVQTLIARQGELQHR